MEGIIILSDITISILNTGDVSIDLLQKLKNRIEVGDITEQTKTIINNIFKDYKIWLDNHVINEGVDVRLGLFHDFANKVKSILTDVDNIDDLIHLNKFDIILETHTMSIPNKIDYLESTQINNIEMRKTQLSRLLGLYLMIPDINKLQRLIEINNELKILMQQYY